MWCLEGLKGQYQGQFIALKEDTIWLGRGISSSDNPPNVILFEDGAVSRPHCVLVWQKKYRSYVIQHKSQTNPTFLNDEAISEPKLLKQGDKVSVGHQTLSFEPVKQSLPLGIDEPEEEATVQELPLNIGFKVAGENHVASAQTCLRFRISGENRQVTGPHHLKDGAVTEYRIPGILLSEISFELDSSDGRIYATLGQESRLPGKRLTVCDGLLLEVPITTGTRRLFAPGDHIVVQGLDCWLPSPDGDTVDLEARAPRQHEGERLAVLEFQTGSSQGTKIAVLDPQGTSIEIGPNCVIGEHALSLPDIPTCKIIFAHGSATIEVTNAREGQYASLSGELLLPGQRSPLVSGSGLFLGGNIMYWVQPSVHAQLTKYQMITRQTVFPISKALLKIGTAAHCEIPLQGNGLIEVTGTVEFTSQDIVYRHLDPVTPAIIDGKESVVGSEISIKDGSKLELGLGNSVELQRK